MTMIAEQPIQTNRYPAYKDSGIDWLGEIPAHWEVGRIKYTCKINQQSLPENTAKSFHIQYVDIGSITLQGGIVQAEEFEFKNAPSRARRIAKKGDTVISTVRTYLKAIAFVDERQSQFIYSTGFAVLNPCPSIMPKFLAMAVKSDSFTEQVSANSKGMSYPAINSTELGCLAICLPPLSEQTRIAKFLDRKTAQIDQAIAQKERLIELLNERRQVMVHKAVTRGLDPNAPMKDSGIDWIGKIPAHWVVSKLGNYATVNNGTTPSRDNAKYWNNGTVPWISSGKVNDFIIENAAEFITEKALRECSLKLFPKGTILIGIVGQGKTRGTSAILNIPATINQNLAGIISNKKLHHNFLHNYLIVSYKEIRNGNGSNQEALNCRLVASIKIIVPPIYEQLDIIKFIDASRNKIQAAIGLKIREIKLLQELKSTLINSAVTGKIKV